MRAAWPSAFSASAPVPPPSTSRCTAMPTEPVLNPSACAPMTLPLHPAAAALEHLAVTIDEKVVADVVPAVGLDVVELDAAHDRRGLLRLVRARAGGVMNDGEARAPARSAAPPARSSRRPSSRFSERSSATCEGHLPDGYARGGAAHEPRSHAGHPTDAYVPPAASSRGPTTGCRASSRSACVRERRGPGGPRPRGPPSATRSTRPRTWRAQLDAAAATPVHADEVEPLGARDCSRRSRRTERKVAAPDRRIGGVRSRRGREQKHRCDQKSSHQCDVSALSSFALKLEAPAMVGCGVS